MIIPLPIGLLKLIDRFCIELKVAEQINSKWGVSPFITQPKTTKPSNFFILFLTAKGISNTPGIVKILTWNFALISFFLACLTKLFVIFCY